jgi:serine/threonine protein kinase
MNFEKQKKIKLFYTAPETLSDGLSLSSSDLWQLGVVVF